ncbi:MAG TPA: hypothetical protein VG826_12145 [Pirellulales bacterium]|nr:hypothetical protein [Pirellulales bacterium]
MNRAFERAVRQGVAAVAVMAAICSPLRADDFHIDNKLHPGDKSDPIETTTLFASGRVYDFMKTPEETIILDPTHDLIVILDPDRRLKTQITTGDVSTQIQKLHEAAKNHPKESVRDSAAAKFAESVDPETGELKLTNKWMQYVVKSKAPERPQVARQYADAADWLAQLNALLNPPSLPFPRLALNRVLRERQELPEKITLTLTPEGRHKPVVKWSEHTILTGLSQRDRQRIDTAGQQMHTFDDVPFDRYHRVEEQAATDANPKR